MDDHDPVAWCRGDEIITGFVLDPPLVGGGRMDEVATLEAKFLVGKHDMDLTVASDDPEAEVDFGHVAASLVCTPSTQGHLVADAVHENLVDGDRRPWVAVFRATGEGDDGEKGEQAVHGSSFRNGWGFRR